MIEVMFKMVGKIGNVVGGGEHFIDFLVSFEEVGDLVEKIVN